MYDPSLGRWLTPDPIGFAAGDDNLYRFVGNRPVNATDPSGTLIFLLAVPVAVPIAEFALGAVAVGITGYGIYSACQEPVRPKPPGAPHGFSPLGHSEAYNAQYEQQLQADHAMPQLGTGEGNYAGGSSSAVSGDYGYGAEPGYTAEELASPTVIGASHGDYGGDTETMTAQQNQNKACFTAGTPLRTPGGWKNIEDFCVGDRVLSRDEHDPSGDVFSKVVEEVFVTQGLVWHLHAGGQVIRTSAEHPFYVWGDGWVPCNQLKVGDWLLTQDGLCVQVEDLLDTGTWEVLYNIRVADFHTYFVGCDEWGFSVWAHNLCNRGRIQAQGGGVEKSVSWDRETPPTKAEGQAMMIVLKSQLTTKQVDAREYGFSKLASTITGAPASGIDAQYINSWTTPGTKDIRVDLEVRAGKAFVDG